MLRYHLICDKSYGDQNKHQKIEAIRSFVMKQLSNNLVDRPEDADVILVAWWDGFMLKTMRTHYELGKLFVGLNAGTLGFLTNHLQDGDIFPLESCNWYTIVKSPIVQVDITTHSWEVYNDFYINESIFGHDVSDYYTFEVESDRTIFCVEGSGLIINTPQWSTGYAANVGQPILDLSSKLQWVAGIGTKWFDYGYMRDVDVVVRDVRKRDTLHLRLDGKSWSYYKDVAQVLVKKPLYDMISLWFLSSQDFMDRRVLLAQNLHGNTRLLSL